MTVKVKKCEPCNVPSNRSIYVSLFNGRIRPTPTLEDYDDMDKGIGLALLTISTLKWFNPNGGI
jgi:hypothetical protein|tara:strand:+ start:836 stop:1027 length:192 start_codon:yes stop_codon:yes gene_type:complete